MGMGVCGLLSLQEALLPLSHPNPNPSHSHSHSDRGRRRRNHDSCPVHASSSSSDDPPPTTLSEIGKQQHELFFVKRPPFPSDHNGGILSTIATDKTEFSRSRDCIPEKDDEAEGMLKGIWHRLKMVTFALRKESIETLKFISGGCLAQEEKCLFNMVILTAIMIMDASLCRDSEKSLQMEGWRKPWQSSKDCQELSSALIPARILCF